MCPALATARRDEAAFDAEIQRHDFFGLCLLIDVAPYFDQSLARVLILVEDFTTNILSVKMSSAPSSVSLLSFPLKDVFLPRVFLVRESRHRRAALFSFGSRPFEVVRVYIFPTRQADILFFIHEVRTDARLAAHELLGRTRLACELLRDSRLICLALDRQA